MLGRVGLTESVAPDSDAAFVTFGGSDEHAAFSDATDLATVVLRTFSFRDLVALLVVSVVVLRVVEADTLVKMQIHQLNRKPPKQLL